jgi:chorismate mutase
MTRRRALQAILAAALVPLVAAAQGATGFTPNQVRKVDRVLRLIQARLDLAPGTAETRWRTMARIEDHASETALLDKVRSRAAKLGLDPAFAERFASAQIEAGKLMQAARHRQWAADKAGAPKQESRPEGYRTSSTEPDIGADLLAAARDAATVLRRPGGRQLLDARAADLIRVGGQDLLAGQAALKPLYDISR